MTAPIGIRIPQLTVFNIPWIFLSVLEELLVVVILPERKSKLPMDLTLGLDGATLCIIGVFSDIGPTCQR
jgi:hypothetical membrane protein